MSRDAMLLVDALRDPASTRALDAQGWTKLLSMARAEQLVGTLAERLKIESVPPKVAEILAEARINTDYQRRSALWEADCARRALASYGGKIVLLKGTAYAAAGLPCSAGRQIGDLDILVLAHDIRRAENELLEAGWEWVKSDPYDDFYYREHMHELPPLIHNARDRMIDVHHTILPKTHRITPDALVLVAEAVETPSGFRVLSPPAMVCHCAAHLLADGDLQGGLRNLWDFHSLVSDFLKDDPQFHLTLMEEAHYHGLWEVVLRALRLSHRFFATPLIEYDWPFPLRYEPKRLDRLFRRRLLARDDWGRPTNFMLQQAFYIRSHWLRMPPTMLAKHLWTKWRKR